MMTTDARDIRLVALDVDGVLTDGSILLDDRGVETKRFCVRDGLALRVWMELGFEVAIVTRRAGEALQHRARELGVTRIMQGVGDKREAIRALEQSSGIGPEAMAFVGDDWPDLAAMRAVGYPIAVADAEPAVIELARHVTARAGGRGAVRDAVMHLIDARGLMDRALAMYE